MHTCTFKVNILKLNSSLVSKQLGYEDCDKDNYQDITAPEHYLFNVMIGVCVCLHKVLVIIESVDSISRD